GRNVWGPARGHAEQQLPPRHQDHVTLVRLARPVGAAEHVELDGRIGQLQVERGQAVRPNVVDHRVDAAMRILAGVGEGGGLRSRNSPVVLTLYIGTWVWIILFRIAAGGRPPDWFWCARRVVGSHVRMLLRVRDRYDCGVWRPATIGSATVDAQSENLVSEAEATYNGVVRDPAKYAARIPMLIARARSAGNTEALIVALRAQAWARHVVLDNLAAKKTLDKAARLAHRERLSQRLGDVLVTRAVALHEL